MMQYPDPPPLRPQPKQGPLKRRVSLWFRSFLLLFWLYLLAIVPNDVIPFFQGISSVMDVEKSTTIFIGWLTGYLVLWLIGLLIIWFLKTTAPPLSKTGKMIYLSVWGFILSIVFLALSNNIRDYGFREFLVFIGFSGIIILILGWLGYIISINSKVKPHLAKAKTFFNFAFARENLYKTSIFIFGLITMISVLIIALILLF